MTTPTKEQVLRRIELFNTEQNRKPKPPRPAVNQLDIEVDDLPLALRPPLSLLEEPAGAQPGAVDTTQIPVILRKFKIPSEVIGCDSGPTLSRVLVKPHLVQRVSTITRLEQELAFYLRVPTVRVVLDNESGLLALEIPNPERAPVRLSQLLAEPAPIDGDLMFPAGIAIDGTPRWYSLAKAPHLLVAGTTGSGKSVFLHSLITSLLMQYQPRELQLALIDLKRGVELGVYERLPHTLFPSAYTPEEAMSTLVNLQAEMDRRYQAFKAEGVRNIEEYREAGHALPRVLTVIDELAYLFMDYPDCQDYVVGLAQLGRAAGIHLVVATQHPSRDIISGRVKANFSARIAFMTGSRVDSTVILDHAGAERLLSKGDGLFRIPGYTEERITACLAEAHEVAKVAEWWSTAWPGKV